MMAESLPRIVAEIPKTASDLDKENEIEDIPKVVRRSFEDKLELIEDRLPADQVDGKIEEPAKIIKNRESIERKNRGSIERKYRETIEKRNRESIENAKQESMECDVAVARNGHKSNIQSVALPQPPIVQKDEIQSARTSSGNESSSSATVTVRQSLRDKGIQEISVKKDEKGKLGIKVKNIKKGVYAMEIIENSPSAKAGIFPGDRILQINGVKVDEYSEERMHKLFKKLPTDEPIRMVVNKRPLERKYTFNRDAKGLLGFIMRGPKIQTVSKDSPAAIQGLTKEYYIVEVNGTEIRGLKESDVHKLFNEQMKEITITVMPYYLYEPLFKQIPIRY